MKRIVIAGLIMVAFSSVVLPSTAVETRGIWVDKSDVYKGKEYIASRFDSLASANFNVVCLPTMHKGYVAYKGSEHLPPDPDIMKIDENMVQWLIDEAHDRGFFAEAWPEYGFYTYHTSDAASTTTHGALLDKYPELTAIDSTGVPYLHNEQWGDFFSLCPSNPKSHTIMIDLMLEQITRFDFDGLNLDRIRYPTKDFCFCPYCKGHFKEDTGYTLTAESLEDEKVLDALYAWRKEQLNQFMKKLHTAIRKARPDILITADVWPPDQNQINEKGQDWGTWLRQGYINVAIPMMYWKNIGGTVEGAITTAGTPERVVCGISAEVNNPEELVRQIQLVRKKNASGVVIWYLGKISDDIETLKNTVFKNPAQPYKKRNIIEK